MGNAASTAIPAVVGKAISLGGQPFTIIGVLGDFDFADFGAAAAADLWLPFQLDPNTTTRDTTFRPPAG